MNIITLNAEQMALLEQIREYDLSSNDTDFPTHNDHRASIIEDALRLLLDSL